MSIKLRETQTNLSPKPESALPLGGFLRAEEHMNSEAVDFLRCSSPGEVHARYAGGGDGCSWFVGVVNTGTGAYIVWRARTEW